MSAAPWLRSPWPAIRAEASILKTSTGWPPAPDKFPAMPVPVVWHPAYEVDIGPHVFPTRKYRLVRERLLAEGTVSNADLSLPTAASDEQVALVHTADYLRKIRTGTLSAEEQLLLEVPFSPALREAAWLCAGASTLAGRLARQRGI